MIAGVVVADQVRVENFGKRMAAEKVERIVEMWEQWKISLGEEIPVAKVEMIGIYSFGPSLEG